MDTKDLLPWTATVRECTVIVELPKSYQVLSWAPLNGGLVEARTILNHQVRQTQVDDMPLQEPEAFLSALAQRLDVREPVVGLMTGVSMDRAVRRVQRRDTLFIECFATVGLSNALAVGDSATYTESPGTINVIVVVNRPLVPAALAEAVGIVTEAKVRALYDAGVKSTVSEALATGTGTDCVALACPAGVPAYRYCGKHTQIGELLGRVVGEAVTAGLWGAGVSGVTAES
jgi:adenosylcobinamide amidohydrolase